MHAHTICEDNIVVYTQELHEGEDDRWRALLDRLAALRQVIVPGVLLGTVRMINDLDLSLTHLATLYVLRPQQALAVNQVADTIGLSVSQASRIVDHLVRHGLVRRTEDERDRRTKRVSISPAGRELLSAFERNVTEAQFSAITELSPDEQAIVIRAIDLMAGAAAAKAAVSGKGSDS